MKVFVLAYDRKSGELLRLHEYGPGDYDAAHKQLLIDESEYPAPDFEVVLLEAPSEEDLRQTHLRYFEKVERRLEAVV